MTIRYYGVPLGNVGMSTDVTEAASTTSAVIELAVTYTTTGMTKMTVLRALEALEAYITADTWPPT